MHLAQFESGPYTYRRRFHIARTAAKTATYPRAATTLGQQAFEALLMTSRTLRWNNKTHGTTLSPSSYTMLWTQHRSEIEAVLTS